MCAAVFDDYTSIPKVHRIDRFARLGNPGPWIKAIADRANDQGGTVDLLWDSGDNENLASFRSSGQFRFWRATEGSQPPVWQLLGTQNAGNLCTRSFGATTPNIAVNGTGNKTRFRIEAYDPSTSRSWYSLPDSAFSVDNLAPAKPTGLTLDAERRTRHAALERQRRERFPRSTAYAGAPARASRRDRAISLARPR